MIEIILANAGAVQTALADLVTQLDGYERVTNIEGSACAADLGKTLATVCKHRLKLARTAKKKPEPPSPQAVAIRRASKTTERAQPTA